MRIGIFGGTFDPPHNGHIALARACREGLDLDEVLFVPAAQNPLKTNGPRASAKDRLAMLGLIAAGEPGVGVVDLEIQKGGTSYTADTLTDLTMAQPADYWFLLGGDALKGFGEWKNPQKILRLARLGVVLRPSQADADVVMRFSEPYRERVDLIRMTPVDVSSTEIRQRISRGQTIAPYVPQAIQAYIEEKGLYQG